LATAVEIADVRLTHDDNLRVFRLFFTLRSGDSNGQDSGNEELIFFNIQTWILFIFGLAPQIRALQGFSYLPEIWRVSSL
jgi:hypothetical protein